MALTKHVDLPTAKLLKEKGFDHPTKSYRQKSTVIGDETILPIMYGRKSFNWNNHPSKVPFYSMPTIAEVVMWLYEKHGIWIYSYDEDCIKRTFGYHISLLNEEDTELYSMEHIAKSIVSGFDGTTFNSPTEAYEAAIKYCLENLI